MNVRGGHFLDEDVGLFDAAFFGLSAETAAVIFPPVSTFRIPRTDKLAESGSTVPVTARVDIRSSRER